MRSALLATMAAACVAAGGGVVGAHHSYSDFQDQATSIQGSIVAIEFANPHTTIVVRASDGTTYTATWNAASQLARMGVRNTDLKVEDVVAITGFAHRDPGVHELSKLREVRRVGDGWAWTLPRAAAR